MFGYLVHMSRIYRLIDPFHFATDLYGLLTDLLCARKLRSLASARLRMFLQDERIKNANPQNYIEKQVTCQRRVFGANELCQCALNSSQKH